METLENRRKRKAFYLKTVIDGLNTVLECYEYNPDSATLEEQKAGINKGMISRIEHGADFQISTLAKILTAYRLRLKILPAIREQIKWRK